MQLLLHSCSRLGTKLQAGNDFDNLYNYLLSNPENVLLIFDGLDELSVGSDCSSEEEATPDDYNHPMTIFSIYKKLLCGKFLPGATVVTTSRSTAEHVYDKLPFDSKVEILGFTKPQIEEYVVKFCDGDDNMSTTMWNNIEGSAELMSLCYIPASCFIVCFTLKRCLEHEALPKTVTELYRVAIRLLLWDHHPDCKNVTKEKDFLTSDSFFSDDIKVMLKNLKTLAKSGMENGKLVFKLEEGEMRKLRNCGLVNSIENDIQANYCFLHLTIQEFFCAWAIVDSCNEPDDVAKFLSSSLEKPSWHLVIQFFAGLLGDKVRRGYEGTLPEDMYKR